MIANSPCPYANRGTYTLVGPMQGLELADGELDRLAAALNESREPAVQDRVDAVALYAREAPDCTLTDVAAFLRDTLDGLRARDDTNPNLIAAELAADERNWEFEYKGVRYFLPVFSSVYAEKHPRYSGIPGWSMILFQPGWSFNRFGISRHRKNRVGLSAQVASVFAAHGIHYEIESATAWYKATRYIKPLAEGDEPVRWWVGE
ncbi:YqcI/YcgG family protein [Streptomyces olivaceus]|uniref:YqcI/YcgG family protein n=1 Tax=Streptomyces olivaceus TaxID=47716 RepID=UPI001CCEA404|nr:YqcI/YcgG family protein [Streptomyces olivaceus]MBZ6081324.1 YqcI/YcgG family protein [Streptomyces olivaceus]